MKNLFERCIIVYKANKEKGFWSNSRTLDDVCELIMSEVTESLEGKRKDLPDDKIPEYPMDAMELADVIIRCMDALGGWIAGELICVTSYEKYSQDKKVDFNNIYDELHISCDRLMDIMRAVSDSSKGHTPIELLEVIKMCNFLLGDWYGVKYDIEEMIQKKLSFNSTRPYKHGKKF